MTLGHLGINEVTHGRQVLMCSICLGRIDLQQIQVTAGVLAIHYINDILAGKLTKKQVEMALQLVVGTMTSGTWARKDPTQQVHFLRVTWAHSQEVPLIE